MDLKGMKFEELKAAERAFKNDIISIEIEYKAEEIDYRHHRKQLQKIQTRIAQLKAELRAEDDKYNTAVAAVDRHLDKMILLSKKGRSMSADLDEIRERICEELEKA